MMQPWLHRYLYAALHQNKHGHGEENTAIVFVANIAFSKFCLIQRIFLFIYVMCKNSNVLNSYCLNL